jgi:predicted ATPase
VLVRLQVSGFKNLVDVDLRFGPFTCIAGANAVGKSNLFDAIAFLAALAETGFLVAARGIRGSSTAEDLQDLFQRRGDGQKARMRFRADMVIPRQGLDLLGQTLEATSTLLRYDLELGYGEPNEEFPLGRIVLIGESLTPVSIDDAREFLGFDTSAAWRDTALIGHDSSPLLEVGIKGEQYSVRLARGGPWPDMDPRFLARPMHRTVLSALQAFDSHPTAVLAQIEMKSWRRFQLDASAIRGPDGVNSPGLRTDGSNLAATLYHLARRKDPISGEHDPDRAYAQVAGLLFDLTGEMWEVFVDLDEDHRRLTVKVRNRRNGEVHTATALSDGTLRFLALAVLALDSSAHDVICLEEPENGIHPARIPALLGLLRSIATDTDWPVVDADNPLRQVIINTHSPVVVANVQDADLVVARSVTTSNGSRHPLFAPLPHTWRAAASPQTRPLSLGALLEYLTQPARDDGEPTNGAGATMPVSRRVQDRDDVRQMIQDFGDLMR